MKFLLFSLVLALVACSAFGRRIRSQPNGRRQQYDTRMRSNIAEGMRRLAYATGNEIKCDLCEMVVGDIQSILSGQQSEIENLLDSLCDELPAPYNANCTALVDEYLPLLFTLIDDMTPAEVCELLTLCTSTQMPEVTGRESLTSVFNYYFSRVSRTRTLKERRIAYMRDQVGEGYLCEACEDSIAYVHEFVACNQTWGEIAEFLEPLCELCPSEYRSQCVQFFQDLPGDVNEFADEYLDPETDCEILGFCPSDEEEEEEPVEAQEPEVPEEEPEMPARVPEQVEPRAQRIQVDVDTQVYDMSRYMKKQGKKLPKATMKNMKRLGSRGMDRMRIPRAIVVHVAGASENQIPYDISGVEGNHYEAVPAQKKCEVCRYFSSAAEGVLEYNEEDITNGLNIVFEDICNAVPSQFKDECESEIKDVVPGVLYQAALKIMNPDYLCTELIGICQ